MKIFLRNIGYFFKEVKKIIGLNVATNIISVISTSLILFVLGIVLCGLMISNQLVDKLEKEAEVSVYLDKEISKTRVEELMNTLEGLDGIFKVTLIDEETAYLRMEEVLGEEAKILTLLNENPFSPYFELGINLNSMEEVFLELNQLEGIDYIRDNKEMLHKLNGLTKGIKMISLFILIAVGITTVVIIAHLIRQGIYNNKEQINTLILLGAPNSYVNFPFLLSGLLPTLVGGVLSSAFVILLLHNGYEKLSSLIAFLPLPLKEEMSYQIGLRLILLSVILGLLGSFIGLLSVKTNK